MSDVSPNNLLFLFFLLLTSCPFFTGLSQSSMVATSSASCQMTAKHRISLYSEPLHYTDPEVAEFVAVIEDGVTLEADASIKDRFGDMWYQLVDAENTVLGLAREDGVWTEDEADCAALPTIETFPQLDPIDECYMGFWGDGAPFPVFDGPRRIDREQLGYVDSIEPYLVLATSEDRYQVVGDGGVVGWVNRTGSVAGACDDLPFVETRPEAPEGQCSVYYYEPAEVTFYPSAEFKDQEQFTYLILEAGYLAVIGANRDGYQLQLTPELTGWIVHYNTAGVPWLGECREYRRALKG